MVAGAVYPRDRIQAELAADAAIVGWLDLKTQPGAADPKGDHWACVVRRIGQPVWVRITGSGPDQAWTKSDDELAGRVRKLMSDNQPAEGRQPLADLARQRLDPLTNVLAARGDLPAVKHLIVLPSPALDGIPIESLLESRPAGLPRFLVSYSPSGTMFAWLQERRHEDKDRPARSHHLLALGDPVPPPNDRLDEFGPKPPDHGLLVRAVPPGSNGGDAGIQPGDVLLSFAGTRLTSRDDLEKQVQAAVPKASDLTMSVCAPGRRSTSRSRRDRSD